MKEGYCKICAFLRRNQWERRGFEGKIAEGLSLKKLQVYLSALGLESDTKTISSHLKHIDSEVLEQRKSNRSLTKKLKAPFQKVSKFFINPDKAIPKSECEHLATRRIFNMNTEKLDEYCRLCGKLLGSYPIERGERQDYERNKRIYIALKRRRP